MHSICVWGVYVLDFTMCLQAEDWFVAQADICQLGNDQRKVNMLAREYCEATKRKLKPVIVSHSMLPGLKEGQEKMSKSDPESAIFMEDSEADVNAKIKKAYCPPQVVEGNPCIEYIRFIVLPWFGQFKVLRTLDNGGDMCVIYSYILG
jgi:tyrosyl-tRNA synthetase